MAQLDVNPRSGAVRRGNLVIDAAKPAVVLMAITIVLLPKMGIPLGAGVPLYASVIVGQILAFWGLMGGIRHPSHAMSQVILALVVACFIFWLGHFLVELSKGVSIRRVARMVFNFLPFTAFGVALFIIFRPRLLDLTFRTTRWAFYGLLLYALAQLIFGSSTVAVQFITANYDQSFDQIINRHNVIRLAGGNLHKLFGTYQNGNLFSIALILLAPLALHREPNWLIKAGAFALLHIIILFSASTTSYISLALLDVVLLSTIREIRLYLPFLAMLVFGAILVTFLTFCEGGDCSAYRLFEARLLNRDFTQNQRWYEVGLWFQTIGAAPYILFTGELSTADQFIFEVLPFSILQFYGVFVFALFYAVIIMALNPLRFRPYKAGLLVYLVGSIGDGGFWLTPTPYLLGLVVGLIVAEDQRLGLRGTRKRQPT